LTYRNNPELEGFPVSRIETISKGEIDFGKVGYGGVTLAGNEKHLLKAGDILFSHINSMLHVGKVAIYKRGMPELLHGMNLLRITPNSDFIPEFLFYVLQSNDVRKQIWSKAKHAVNQASINIRELKSVVIPKPPINEQHKIVELLEDHLSRLDAALADVKQAKIMAAQFRRSILQAAFSGYLTSRETVSGTSLPEDWAHRSIGDMCRSVSKIDPINLGRDSFKYVDIGSLEPSSSSLENIEAIQTTDAPGRARQLLAVGDSIFATVRPYMKKVAYISQEFDGEIASTGFCVLRPIEEQLHAKYLFYFLLSDDLLDQVLPLQRGVSYPAIRDNDLRNAFIPLPLISEQQRIVAILEDYFSRMEATTKIADDMEKQAAALRRSLLQAAFTGQLTKEVISV
jgi:type I restriction enzyme S subunit